MKKIPQETVSFLNAQGFVIVSSIDQDGFPHSSCKALAKTDPLGEIFLVDAYSGVTHENIKVNPRVSVSAVDEHKFTGYCLKGKAKILSAQTSQELIKSWEDNLTSRLAKRLLKNLAQEHGRGDHPEAKLPQPRHIIAVEIEEIVDLAPYNLRKSG